MKITIELSDTDVRALETEMVSVEAWIQNFIAANVRRAKRNVCKETLKNTVVLPNKILQQVIGELGSRGIIVVDTKDIPDDLQNLIVENVSVKSGAEKEAEFIDNM